MAMGIIREKISGKWPTLSKASGRNDKLVYNILAAAQMPASIHIVSLSFYVA